MKKSSHPPTSGVNSQDRQTNISIRRQLLIYNGIFNDISEINFSFLNFSQENICCKSSLELPQWGTSNEYSQHTYFMEKRRKIIAELSQTNYTTSPPTHAALLYIYSFQGSPQNFENRKIGILKPFSSKQASQRHFFKVGIQKSLSSKWESKRHYLHNRSPKAITFKIGVPRPFSSK